MPVCVPSEPQRLRVPCARSWFLRQVCKVTTTPGLVILIVVGLWYLGYRIARMLVFAGSSPLILRNVQQDCVKPLARLVMLFAQALNKLSHACVTLESADSVLRCLAVRWPGRAVVVRLRRFPTCAHGVMDCAASRVWCV